MTTTATTPVPLVAGTWQLDTNHTSVGFTIRRLGLAKVRDWQRTVEDRDFSLDPDTFYVWQTAQSQQASKALISWADDNCPAGIEAEALQPVTLMLCLPANAEAEDVRCWSHGRWIHLTQVAATICSKASRVSAPDCEQLRSRSARSYRPSRKPRSSQSSARHRSSM